MGILLQETGRAVAYLLFGKLGPPFWPPLLDFSNNLGDGPPLWEVICREKTKGYLGAQSQCTFFVSPKIFLVLFFLNWPLLFKNLINTTAVEVLQYIMYLYLCKYSTTSTTMYKQYTLPQLTKSSLQCIRLRKHV